MHAYEQLARHYHQQLPVRIREYLRTVRGLSDSIIDLHQLGWNGKRITIPVRNRSGEVGFFKLAKSPDDSTKGAKMKTTFGAHAELYGWERVHAGSAGLIICEGEFDRLVLESRGYAAATSTAGALTFRLKWAEVLRQIPSIFVCFDRDAAGEAGARLVGSLIPDAKIVSLPDDVGSGGDVSDFFVRLARAKEDFEGLLGAAAPLAEHERVRFGLTKERQPVTAVRSEAADLKSQVRIEDWIGSELTLTVCGKNYVARCPFHADRTPSFVVFPDTQLYHCFGCRAHGDVFTYLMRTRGVNFAAAFEVIRESLNNNDGEAAA